MRLIPLTLIFFIVMIPMTAFPASDEVKQGAPSALTGVIAHVKTVLGPAKKFLTKEADAFKDWMRDTLNVPRGQPISKVVIELPPLVKKEPTGVVVLPEPPEMKSAVIEELVESVQEKASTVMMPETPVPVEKPTPPGVSPVVVSVVQEAVIEQPVREIRVFQPGKPKPLPAVVVVAAVSKMEESEPLADPPRPLPAPLPVLMPVQVIKTAVIVPPAVSPVAPSAIPVGLMLGQSMSLGMPYRGDEKKCIDKQNGHVLFCAQDIIWPDPVGHLFDSGVSVYRGGQAVVRYDGKKLTHAHAFFLSSGLKQVAAYFETRFGPPLETLQRIVTPFEGRPQNNPTFIWRKNEIVNGDKMTITLEVRGFDDSQGGFPDMEHGLVRLYGTNSLPIFPRVSAMEMMLVKHALN